VPGAMPESSPNPNDPKNLSREIESWTGVRSNELHHEITRNTEDRQSRNRAWWESLPMTYENWDKTDRIPSSAEDFSKVDAFYFGTNPYLGERVAFDGFAGRKVLEIGCGAGSAACRFAGGGASVTAVDLTEQAIALTRAHADVTGVAVDARQMDAEQLDGLGDQTFDFVYSWGVLHHSQNPEHAYRQIARVLKRDGRFLIMVYHKSSARYYIRGLFHLLFKGKIFRGDNLETVQRFYTDGYYHRHYTAREFRQCLESAGLSVESTETTHMSSKMVPAIPEFLRKRLKESVGWLLVARGKKANGPLSDPSDKGNG
jgi:2-polyprenyl-3-methyl-5-hydroxy-6-metoxy-1,4-benzoquinol methylase